MKSFITVAVFTVVAIAALEIAQSDAHRKKKCQDSDRPPLNTTEVTCDRRNSTGGGGGGGPRPAIRCFQKCSKCYDREQLVRARGCLVGGQCQCLARPGNGTATTTTAAPTTGVPGDSTTPAAPTSPGL